MLSFIVALLGYATVTGTHDTIVTEEHRADIRGADPNSTSSSTHSTLSSLLSLSGGKGGGHDRIQQEIMEYILAEDNPNHHRRLGGGQSCGAGEYTFEFAINGVITTWTAQFCDQYTRLAYNFNVI